MLAAPLAGRMFAPPAERTEPTPFAVKHFLFYRKGRKGLRKVRKEKHKNFQFLVLLGWRLKIITLRR